MRIVLFQVYQSCIDYHLHTDASKFLQPTRYYYYFKNVCVFGDKYKAETVAVETKNKTNIYILDQKYAYLFFE